MLADPDLAAGAMRQSPGSGGSGLGQTPKAAKTTSSSSTVTSATSATSTTTTVTTSSTSAKSTRVASSTGVSTTPYASPPAYPAGWPSSLRARGMWIWVLSDSDGGNLSAIIAQAERYGIKTLIIKSSDGTGLWSQFNPTVVSELHAARLHVCAWQYVYGAHPILEAEAGAAAVADGADCLVIDAEVQYEGRYVQAQEYVNKLRALIGANFPLALAGFPYIDYHPAFPYSVFLGTGGAQYNMPQMYWYDIGTTVSAVYRHTYEFNEIYQRPISPLGQVFDAPPVGQIYAFRAISRYYGGAGGGGISWWDWQEAGSRQFAAAIDYDGFPIVSLRPNHPPAGQQTQNQQD